jgi:protein-L-isoaspartate O-methyltransferase
MGVDSAAFAKKANQVVYVERQEDLKEITAYNHAQLGHTNIQHILGDGLAYLNQAVSTFDFIYLDELRCKSLNRATEITALTTDAKITAMTAMS